MQSFTHVQCDIPPGFVRSSRDERHHGNSVQYLQRFDRHQAYSGLTDKGSISLGNRYAERDADCRRFRRESFLPVWPLHWRARACPITRPGCQARPAVRRSSLRKACPWTLARAAGRADRRSAQACRSAHDADSRRRTPSPPRQYAMADHRQTSRHSPRLHRQAVHAR
ncbi:hypothetical protein ALP26_104045 [Pseudomonas savastanoi pv. glycinea]|nr:hypothetical protein ALQ67_104028 [Pseudomonas savastanoi pv. glycinea]RMU77772.1 hypothetical protein ALP26_104045 [Pseudomonas savastanoi pv. glycinea]